MTYTTAERKRIDTQASVKRKIEELRTLEPRDFEIWRFFEHRADEIKGSLWATATWLVTLKSALLAFTLSDRILEFTDSGIPVKPLHPLVVLMLSGLGLALVMLTFTIVDDIVKHIHINWYRASTAKGDYEAVSRGGRIYTLLPLYVVEVFFAFAFISLFSISWRGGSIDWFVLSLVLMTVVMVTLYKTGVLKERPEAPSGKTGTERNGAE